MPIVMVRYPVGPGPGEIARWTEVLDGQDVSVTRLADGGVEFTAWFPQGESTDLEASAKAISADFIEGEPAEVQVMSDAEFEQYAQDSEEPSFLPPPIIDRFWG